ncbi:MAG: hypothetical protein DRQ51_02750 [Gammaproteobacteria bacterium]|nr:MAG: hypothetical protein DRQ51_02750 [Gammaproteobacteria bacterium]
MLQSLSDGIKNSKVLAYTIVIVIIVPFALFGIQSYLGGGGDSYVADIDGDTISTTELDNAYNQQRYNLISQFGGKIPSQLDNPKMLKKDALNRLIDTRLLQQYSTKNKLYYSNDNLSANILSQKQFHKNDKFDEELYDAQLRSQGYSIAEFENRLRNAMILDQMQNIITKSSFTTEHQKNRINNLLNQKRELNYYTINGEKTTTDTTVDEKQIIEYYKKNKDQFQNLPKVKVNYLELKNTKITKNIEVDDKKLKELYDLQKQDLISLESRVAAHILIKIPKDATDKIITSKTKIINDIRERLDNNEDFKTIATKKSEDVASAKLGGDLGVIEKGMMVKPFEDALFSMQEGEVSEPIKTQFGLHLIQLSKINKPEQKSFVESKDSLKKEYIKAKTDSLFYDLSELMANSSYENPTTLEPASHAIDVKIIKTDWIEQNSSKSIAKHPKIAHSLFDKTPIDEKINSEVIEVSANHLIVFRVTDYQDANPKPLKDVKDIIITLIKDGYKNDKKLKIANEVKKTLEKGSNLELLKEKYNINYKTIGFVSRNNNKENSQIIDRLFSLPTVVDDISKIISSPVLLDNNKYALVLAGKVANKKNKIDNNKNDDEPQLEDKNTGQTQYQVWLDYLKNNTSITINKY